jgi:hypothetical protein
MNFKKIALASAIAAMPMGAYALEEISDESMADVSGQDGISAVLATPTAGLTASVYLHDKGGLSNISGMSAYSFDGAIVIQNLAIAAGVSQNITINVDAGASATSGGSAILNVNVALPAALTISTGVLRVANSQRDDAAPGWSIDGLSNTIMSPMTIILGSTQLNIQLGNEAQVGSLGGTDMIVMSAAITSGLIINSFRLDDANSSGAMSASSITITDTGSTAALTLAIDGNISNAGLVLGLGTVGTGGMDIRIVDQRLGTTTNAPLGDVSIVGLNLNGATLTINGKN